MVACVGDEYHKMGTTVLSFYNIFIIDNVSDMAILNVVSKKIVYNSVSNVKWSHTVY